MEIFGNYNMAQNLGSFWKSAILRPFGGKFRKVFNTKVVRLGKTSPTEVESRQSEFVWNFYDRNKKLFSHRTPKLKSRNRFSKPHAFQHNDSS